MRGARIILARELYEIVRSPVLLFSMASLPTVVVGIPLAMAWYIERSAAEAVILMIRDLYHITAEAPASIIAEAATRNWLPIFMVMPVFLPILIAAQSVAGERERRTLEPLLATPVSTLAIVAAKSVAAVVPAVAITWIASLIFVGGLSALTHSAGVPSYTPDALWVFSILVLSPLLALFGNALAVVVSSLVTDPRAAQNIAAMSVVPLIGLVVAQLAGKIDLRLGFYLTLALSVAVADVLLVIAAARVFNRERLLTWR